MLGWLRPPTSCFVFGEFDPNLDGLSKLVVSSISTSKLFALMEELILGNFLGLTSLDPGEMMVGIALALLSLYSW